jgi:hypothetical protein
MEKTRVTPKDFFFWTGAMIALYLSVFSLLALLFDYIDTAFPDPLTYSYDSDPYSGGIRLAIASLVVLFPVFLILMRLIRADIARNPEKKGLWVRRWALVLTLFVSSAAMVIDLITLINTYLGGELSTHFILKVAVVLLVGAGIFMHFLADIWGYWDANPSYARSIGWAASFLIFATIGSAFFIIGTPDEIRLYRFDDQKVSDLQNIQSEIVNYWQTEGTLPPTLSSLTDSLGGFTVPVDEQTGAQYSYATTSLLSFKLCADFNAATQPDSPTVNSYSYPAAPSGVSGQDLATDSWYHDAGSNCYARTIDPNRYPQTTPPTTK